MRLNLDRNIKLTRLSGLKKWSNLDTYLLSIDNLNIIFLYYY